MATALPIPLGLHPGRTAGQHKKTLVSSNMLIEFPLTTEEEIHYAIFRGNLRKAPGADTITFNMWWSFF